MADKEGIPTTSEAIVVSTTPDVCLRPLLPNAPTLLSSTFVAVPHTIVGRFSDIMHNAPLVRFTGFPTVTSKSRITLVTGDEPGTGGGVVSGVNQGYCRPITFSSTVRSGGGFNIKDGSLFWMNCAGPEGPGNTQGRAIYVKCGPFVSISPTGAILGDTNPSYAPETPKEKDFWSHAGDFFVGAAKGAADAVGGAIGLGVGGWNLTGGWLFNAEESKKTWSGLTSAVGAVLNNPGLVWDAFAEPYAKAWKEGRPLEAIGRGGFDIASLIFGVKGADKIGKGGKAAATAAEAASGVGTAAPLIGAARVVAQETDEAARILADLKKGIIPENLFPDMIPDAVLAADGGGAKAYRWQGGKFVEMPEVPPGFEVTVAGNCQNAAADYIRLKREGKIMQLVDPNHAHVWVELPDGRVYDPSLWGNMTAWGINPQLIESARNKAFFTREQHRALLGRLYPDSPPAPTGVHVTGS